MKKLFMLAFVVFISGCALKKPIHSQSATILIKSPTMKFYDKGFITQYKDHTQVQIYSAGQKVLDLGLYETQVCQSTFECTSYKSFNKAYLNPSYKERFLKELFEKTEKETIFRDKRNRILIKIKRD